MPIADYIATVHMPEGVDYTDALKARGIQFTERPVFQGSFSDCALIEYTHPERGARAAYVVTSQTDVDAFRQAVYVFERPLPDGTDILEVVDQIRREVI